MDDAREGKPLLIVNADDYALTGGVSRAVLRAANDGVVTSTSVLAVAPAFEATVACLADVDIGVGAHLAAVGEDPPLLSAHEIPTLVDRRGALPRSWRQLLPRVAAGRIDPADLRREFATQIERTMAAGVRLTHVDTHQHVHLWPPIAEIVMDVAAGAGVSAIRIIRSTAKSPVGVSVRRLARRLEGRCRQRGFRFPAAATGLDQAGRLAWERMAAAIAALGSTGAPSAELATHPGEADDPDLARYRWGYRWSEELDALCSTAVRDAVAHAGFRLGTYADLAPRMSRSAVATVRRAYRGEPWTERVHVWGRARSCPFDAVGARVPRSGRILDLGCGHGLFSLLLAQAPERDVVGMDIDADKLVIARRAAARSGLVNLRFETVPHDQGVRKGWHAICMVDVLYLLGPDEARQLLRSAVGALEPGGVILVKEMDVAPRWKYEVNRVQELAATKVLRITEGRTVAIVPPAVIGSELEDAGLAVEHVSLGRRRLHPHHLVIGRRAS